MSKLISIRDDLYEKLKGEKIFNGNEPGNRAGDTALSSSDKIDLLYMEIFELTSELNKLQETTVTQEGRISKTLAGKTILFKIKE